MIKLLAENSIRFYGVIEVVITLCELLSTAYTAKFFVNPLYVYISNIPKRIARNNPEKTIFKTVNILCFVAKINKPFNLKSKLLPLLLMQKVM